MICDSDAKVKLIVGEIINGRTLLETPDSNSKSVLCRCNCGRQYRITIRHLAKGRTQACQTCTRIRIKQTHGAYTGRNKTCERLHRIWKAMKERCSPGKRRDQQTYYGSGIRVCEDWINDYTAFKAWALANGYRDDLTIDRWPDKKGGYEPGNCRWADQQTQQRNRTNNKHIYAFGETKLLTEWCEDARCTIERSVLGRRISAGWEAERAISQPGGKQALWRKKK
jgi:hypothetical protein